MEGIEGVNRVQLEDNPLRALLMSCPNDLNEGLHTGSRLSEIKGLQSTPKVIPMVSKKDIIHYLEPA
jgi:hypothetical protein